MSGQTCVDINECDTNPCDPDATCTNSLGSYSCSCDPGYSGDGKSCTDNNECANDPCDSNAKCTNTLGSFTCVCNTGFTGDGLTCSDDNECDFDPCDANASCTNTVGGHTCDCNAGFVGNGVTCQDINECDTQNSCHTDALCINEPGSYKCSCKTGFSGDGVSCVDIGSATVAIGNVVRCNTVDGSSIEMEAHIPKNDVSEIPSGFTLDGDIYKATFSRSELTPSRDSDDLLMTKSVRTVTNPVRLGNENVFTEVSQTVIFVCRYRTGYKFLLCTNCVIRTGTSYK